MQNKYKIIVNDPTKAFDINFVNANGVPMFELYGVIDIEEIKTTIGLDDFSRTQEVFNISLTIPYTKNNKYILSSYGFDPYDNNGNYINIPVIVLKNDVALQFTNLKIHSYKENKGAAIVDIDIFNEDGFLKRLSEVDIVQSLIDSGELIYDFGKQNIDSDIDQDFHIYKEGQKPIYFPFVRYSNDMGNMFTNDLRPFINYYFLLERMACLAGYKLDAPLLTTDWFRKKWLYLLKPNYYEYSGKGANLFNERVSRQTPILYNTSNNAIGWDFQNISSFGQRFVFAAGFTETWQHTLNGGMKKITMDFEFDIIYQLKPFIGITIPRTWGLLHLNANGGIKGEYLTDMANDFAGQSINDTHSIKRTYQGLVMEQGDKVMYVINRGAVAGNTWSVEIQIGSLFNAVATGKEIAPYDSIDIAKMLREDISGIDLYKAAMQMMNLKLAINENTKVATLLHADENGSAITNGIESYYTDLLDIVDLTSETIKNSYAINYDNAVQDRYFNFAFKSPSDANSSLYNEELKPNTFLGYRVDIGTRNGKETTYDFENPYFEATPNITALIAHGEVPDFTPDMPVMWDNDKGANVSFDINPRIIHIEFGRTQQYINAPVSTDINRNFKKFIYEGQLIITFPLAYQETTQTYTPITPVASTQLDRNTMLNYEVLTEIFYQRAITEKTNAAIATVLVHGKMLYNTLNTRKPVLIHTSAGARPFKVISIVRIDNNTTQLTLIPINLKYC